MPAGGCRHELGDSFRSLLANSLRTEATFLPDHAGKELDRKAVLCRRLFLVPRNVMGSGRLAVDGGALSGVAVSRLSVHWQAHLPRRTGAAVKRNP